MADEAKVNPAPATCAFFVKRKNRYCKMIVGKGRRYCGEHLHVDGEDETVGRKRIPCPLDPKHTVYEDQLKHHLKKCNVKKKTNVIYYEQNVNSGIDNYQPSPEDKIALPSVPTDRIAEVIQKVNTFYKGNSPTIDERVMFHKAFENEMTKEEYGPSVHKHLKQQASLVGNLDRLGLLRPDTVYMEFGAGRGKLSHWIQQAHSDDSDVEYVMIDRASNRYKFDSCHKRGAQGPSFKRVLLDIEHLNLGKLPCVCDNSKSIVAVSKHLCGTATDLTLRCLLESPKSSLSSTDEASEEDTDQERETKRCRISSPNEVASRVQGVVVALCCHHQCYWPHYVGRPFLQTHGFTSEDFHILCCMSSWATCGIRQTKGADSAEEHAQTDTLDTREASSYPDDEKHFAAAAESNHQSADVTTTGQTGYKGLGLSIADCEEIGRKCKRLLDLGRVWYLQLNGFQSSLAYYVDTSVSLENVMLIATAKTEPLTT